LKGFTVFFLAISLLFLGFSRVAQAEKCEDVLEAIGTLYPAQPALQARLSNRSFYRKYLMNFEGRLKLADYVANIRTKALLGLFETLISTLPKEKVENLSFHTEMDKIKLLFLASSNKLLSTETTALDVFFHFQKIIQALGKTESEAARTAICLILENEPILFDILLAEISVAEPEDFAFWENSFREATPQPRWGKTKAGLVLASLLYLFIWNTDIQKENIQTHNRIHVLIYENADLKAELEKQRIDLELLKLKLGAPQNPRLIPPAPRLIEADFKRLN